MLTGAPGAVSRPGAGASRRLGVVAAVAALVLVGCVGSTDEPAGVDTTEQAATTTVPAAAGHAVFDDLWPEPIEPAHSWAPQPEEVDGLTRLAHTEGTRFVLHTAGGDVDFLPGVNIGPTIPGHHPGELAIRAEDYRRWFPRIADLGLRVVRVYTIQRPAFYDELLAFNTAHPDAPLYVMHGVWIPEERFLETGDLWDDGVVEEMRAEIDRIVAVVHGDITLPDQRGHASGVYTADITPWLAGWIMGIELDPHATAASDEANAAMQPSDGRYVAIRDGATPTEIWLGAMLDHLAGRLAERGITMPLAFTNWPTTDPLRHPDEPLPSEDMVGIDASALQATPAWPGGLFASYHAYPYYPDFQRHQPDYATFAYGNGVDPYAGYLADLRDHHSEMPVLISEFGVPSSLGTAHFGPLGRDQGDHTESEAMAINAELLTIIHDLGLGGGFVFEWTDEWFKLTWNTVDFELPAERRPLWHNQWTNEQVFGLVAVEPGEDGPAVIVDGALDEWAGIPDITPEGAELRVAATHDASWLYLALEGPMVRDGAFTLAFTLSGDGGIDLPDGGTAGGPVDAAVVFPSSDDLSVREEAQAWIRAGQDAVSAIYEFLLEPDRPPVDPQLWIVQRLMTNRPLTVPTTGELFPMETQEVGRLRAGTTDPHDADFDSHAIWRRDGEVVEVRLPWMLLSVSDPSSLQAWRIDGGEISSETIAGLGLGVVVAGDVIDTRGYSWEPWTSTTWHERPKSGLALLAAAVEATHAEPQ